MHDPSDLIVGLAEKWDSGEGYGEGIDVEVDEMPGFIRDIAGTGLAIEIGNPYPNVCGVQVYPITLGVFL